MEIRLPSILMSVPCSTLSKRFGPEPAEMHFDPDGNAIPARAKARIADTLLPESDANGVHHGVKALPNNSINPDLQQEMRTTLKIEPKLTGYAAGNRQALRRPFVQRLGKQTKTPAPQWRGLLSPSIWRNKPSRADFPPFLRRLLAATEKTA